MHVPSFIGLSVVTLFFPVAFIFYKWANTFKKDQEKEEEKLKDRLGDKKKEEKFERERADQLRRVKPMLKMISDRLGDNSILQEDDRGNVIDFDMNVLFNSIDKDGNGIISYSELDDAMQLSGEELKMFIQLMNQAGGELQESREVKRKVFIENFFHVIDDIGNLTPTEQDASDLFDEISKMDSSTIDLEELGSRLAMFLSDKQILAINRLFRQRLGIHPSVPKPPKVDEDIEVDIANGSSNELQAIVCEEVRGQRRMSLLGNSMRTMGVTSFRKTVQGQISKHDFAKLYPSILKEVLVAEETQYQPFDIHFNCLSLHVKANGKSLPVVDNVTGRIQKRTMTAIMGKTLAPGSSAFVNTIFL